MKKEKVYEKIAESAIYGNLGLFIGAGFSLAINEIAPNCNPLSWPNLLASICKENEIKWEAEKDDNGKIIQADIKKEFSSCPEIASQICELISNKQSLSIEEATLKFKEQVSNTTAWYANEEQRNLFQNQLKQLLPSWIITTNYDLILETLLPEETVSLSPKDEFVFPKGKIPIYHLHGIRTDPDTIIITKEDYVALSRPHNYRMERLSLLFSESSTLMIGYAIGDSNVQTALDWSKNVYDEQNTGNQTFPHKIIQLVYKDNPTNEPYETKNGIIIIETNSVFKILKEIIDEIELIKKQEEQKENDLKRIQQQYLNTNEINIKTFLANESIRHDTLKEIIDRKEIVIATESFLSEVFKYLWKKTEPTGAFDEYADIADLFIDIFKNFNLKSFPPSIYMYLVSHLERLSKYIDNKYYCDSIKAYNHWKSNKDTFIEENKNEIKSLGKTYWRIKSLLMRLPFDN